MKFYKLLLAPALMFLLPACQENVNNPLDGEDAENIADGVVATPEAIAAAEDAMSGAYPFANYAWPLEVMSDNIVDNNALSDSDGKFNLPAFAAYDETLFRWETMANTASADTPYSIWTGMYESIAACNGVLESLGDPAQQADSISGRCSALVAEARMLRAYCHFVLAQVFCQPYSGERNNTLAGVPYVTESTREVKVADERGTLSDTYAAIQNDIELALPEIRDGGYAYLRRRFNRQAANAFAARFYLFTRQYAKSVKCASEVLGGESSDGSQYLSGIWSNLDRMMTVSDMGYFQADEANPSTFLVHPTFSSLLRRLGGGCRYALNGTALDATIHSGSPAWAKFRWTRRDDRKTFTMHPCFNGSTISNGEQKYGNALGVNAHEHFEYTDTVAGLGYAMYLRREFSGEETLLTRAEARLFLGDTSGALRDIDTWEKHRRNCTAAEGYQDWFVDYSLDNITAFYSEDNGVGIVKPINIDRVCAQSDAKVSASDVMPMLQCIQHLRRIETLHTGMRWFDIKRLGIEIDHEFADGTTDRLSLNDSRRAITLLPAEPAVDKISQRIRPHRGSLRKVNTKLVRNAVILK